MICLLPFQEDPLLIGRETWLVAGRVTGYTMASLVLANDGRVLVESSSAPILEIHVVVLNITAGKREKGTELRAEKGEKRRVYQPTTYMRWEATNWSQSMEAWKTSCWSQIS